MFGIRPSGFLLIIKQLKRIRFSLGISLATLKSDNGKQCRPRPEAAERASDQDLHC